MFRYRPQKEKILNQHRKFRAEVVENAPINFITIPANPTCPQCRRMQSEIKRLQNIIIERLPSSSSNKPKWQDSWVDEPDNIAPRKDVAFIVKQSRKPTEETDQLRAELGRLQRELRIRSEENYRLRHGTQEPKSNTNTDVENNDVIINEMYNNLFENEWKKAYLHQTKEGVSKEEAIGNLLNVLKQSYSQCHSIASTQLSSILNVSSLKKKAEESQISVTIIDDFLKKKATKYRRDMVASQIPNLQQEIHSNVQTVLNLNKPLKSSRDITGYIDKCIEVMWYVAIQDDVISLDDSVERFSEFDTNRYKYFDSQKENIDYIVWPGLTKNDNSEILSKGVAMATSQTE